MSIKSRRFGVLLFALVGLLLFPLLWLINSFVFSLDLDQNTFDIIEGIQIFFVPGWVFQTLLLARVDGYIFPYPFLAILLVNTIYWSMIGYIVTYPKIQPYWLKGFIGVVSMFLLSNLIFKLHGG